MALAADLDARVKLSALADGFVEDPAAAFPEGRLVRGRVTAIDGSRYACHTALTGYAGVEKAPPPSLLLQVTAIASSECAVLVTF